MSSTPSIGNSNNAFGRIHPANNSGITSDNAHNAEQEVRRPAAADVVAATYSGNSYNKAPVAVRNLTGTSSTDKYIYGDAIGGASRRANPMKSRIIDTGESDYDGGRGSDYEVPIIGIWNSRW